MCDVTDMTAHHVSCTVLANKYRGTGSLRVLVGTTAFPRISSLAHARSSLAHAWRTMLGHKGRKKFDAVSSEDSAGRRDAAPLQKYPKTVPAVALIEAVSQHAPAAPAACTAAAVTTATAAPARHPTPSTFRSYLRRPTPAPPVPSLPARSAHQLTWLGRVVRRHSRPRDSSRT
jgi:hypothetical protein